VAGTEAVKMIFDGTPGQAKINLLGISLSGFTLDGDLGGSDAEGPLG
jgi:hypothetical protein